MWQFISARQIKWFPKGHDAKGKMRFGRLCNPSMVARVVNGTREISVGMRSTGDYTVKWPDVAEERGLDRTVTRPAARGPVEVFHHRDVFIRRLAAIGLAGSTVNQVLSAIGA